MSATLTADPQAPPLTADEAQAVYDRYRVRVYRNAVSGAAWYAFAPRWHRTTTPAEAMADHATVRAAVAVLDPDCTRPPPPSPAS